MISDPKSGKEWKDPGVTQETLDTDIAAIDTLMEAAPDEPEVYMEFLNDLEFHTKSLEIRKQIGNCSTCKLRQSCRQPVPFLGHRSRPTLVALGEAPGATEDILKLGFCGKSGALLRASAKHFGIEISDYINVCCCRPPGNRAPTDQEMVDCGGNLKAQIEHLNPWLVCCFGNTAISAATGRKDLKITRDHGRFFQTIWTNPETGKPIWGYSFFHPRYTLGNMEAKKTKPKDEEAKRKIKSASLSCQKWEEDWERLCIVTLYRDMFGASIVSAEMGSLTLEQVMEKVQKEEPYKPDKTFKSPVGWGSEADFNSSFDDDLGPDEIPF